MSPNGGFSPQWTSTRITSALHRLRRRAGLAGPSFAGSQFVGFEHGTDDARSTREVRVKPRLRFVSGFAIAAALHWVLVTSCGAGPKSPTTVDVTKINEGAARVEAAFTSGDPARVQALLTDQARANYGDDLSRIDPAQLRAFGEDFKHRTLDGYGSRSAQFSFPWKGTVYTVALALADDGSYQLMDF
jgi:hypothetical protein